MADMQIYKTGDGYSFGRFSFIDNGQQMTFKILFIQDEDGIWRIKNF